MPDLWLMRWSNDRLLRYQWYDTVAVLKARVPVWEWPKASLSLSSAAMLRSIHWPLRAIALASIDHSIEHCNLEYPRIAD
ncbi:hypothetical protein AS156_35980 [Bradyrhizobium macuxiense]|uniref:Uncharacterized protein n=1 Tax=Bradyrhizobium macuxiense TaxID=1755647 RepID=A0A125Q9R6_9BRAD|nr:hypothetical protein AS156_35980 [Bradyrhizobium macuxiense]